jgi:polyisoprenoid-binding protein YceI
MPQGALPTTSNTKESYLMRLIDRNPGTRILKLGMMLGLLGAAAACVAFDDPYAQPPGATEVPPTALATAAQVSTIAAATAVTVPATPAGPAATSVHSSTAAPASDDTVRLTLVAGDNEARYRVREQLARLSFPTDAVGATRVVSGTIAAKTDGTVLPESKVQVDLRTLTSDEAQRDRFIKNDPLQTSRYPFAVFAPTALQGLSLPIQSGPVAFKLVGNLTIRDVTKPVTWDVKGMVNGDEATGQATTSFNFDYFNLSKPSVFVVLTVEDPIHLEIDLHLRRVR